MKPRSMFSQLFTILLAVILVLAMLLFTMFYISMRDKQISNRLDQLKGQARELAYMAGRMYSEQVQRTLLGGKYYVSKEYVEWKLERIHKEYNAYGILISSDGAPVLYVTPALSDAELSANMSAEMLRGYLVRLLSGETIAEQTHGASGPMFTVAVPWTMDGAVLGGVFIQTTAQSIRAVYADLLWQMSIAMAAVILLAGAAAYFFAKRTTRPLTAIAATAESMANGDFDSRAPLEGSAEIRALAESFNSMTDQLQAIEQSRRDFVANVSHELRSPVTSIQGFAQGMLDGTIPEESRSQYLQVITDETHRLSKLIANLLNLSRVENQSTELNFTDFDLNEMTRRVLISRVNQIEDKNLEVEADFEEDACFVRADADEIEQVIINLVDNAIKFTPTGGMLTLSTKAAGNQKLLRVKDNGVGILPQDQPHIFDRFYKADKAHTVGKGTGLGLAICKRIMDKHGQSIRLVTGDGGATFEITLEAGKNPGGGYDNIGQGKA